MQRTLILLLNFCVFSVPAFGAIKPSQNFLAENSKKNHYIEEGTVVGGDKTVTNIQIVDLRHAPPHGTDGYERIVLELKSTGNIASGVPHYELAAVPEKKRMILSLWSAVSYNFKKEKAETLFRKSHYVQKLNPVPIVEDDLATLEFVMKEKTKVEAFSLSNPPRIVLDFKK